MRELICRGVFGMLAVLWVCATASGQCEPRWADWFAGGDIAMRIGFEGPKAGVVFERGGKSMLCLGGRFDSAAGLNESHIGCWDGYQWIRTGVREQGVRINEVRALTVFDDGQGGGPQLYVGGNIVGPGGSGVVRWDGETWEVVGNGLNDDVNAFAVYDDGTGPSLYAAGEFHSHVEGVLYHSIARWDGIQWQPLQTSPGQVGVDGVVNALGVYDSGSGPVLLIGGFIQTRDPLTYHGGLFTWNGTALGTLGGGVGPSVTALGVIPEGQAGAGVYVVGTFDSVGRAPSPVTPANGMAHWNGTTWTGIDADWSDAPTSITVVPEGEPVEPGLYICGDFASVGGEFVTAFVHYSPGNGFNTVGEGFPFESSRITGMATLFGQGADRGMYVGGTFYRAGDTWCRNLATWNGERWSRVGNAPSLATSNSLDLVIWALESWDDGTGPALYVGGTIDGAGPVNAANMVRWNGSEWSDAGGSWGLHGAVLEIVAGRVGAEEKSALYVLGTMGENNQYIGGVLRWDGVNRSVVGGGLGMHSTQLSLAPAAASIFDADGDGANELYVGGRFLIANGAPANNVAKWDGTAWSPVGAGFDERVADFTVFDDGNGPALYACGRFRFSGKTPVNGIARLGPSGWEALGSGLEDAPLSEIVGGASMAVYDDGQGGGPALYVLGFFLRAGGMSAPHLARWDGAAWSAVNAGVTLRGIHHSLRSASLAVYDDRAGGGPELYISGSLPDMPEIGHTVGLARWNGRRLDVLEDSFDGPAYDMHVFDDGHGPSLFAGGQFDLANGLSSMAIAQLVPCQGCACDWDNSNVVNSQDFFDFLNDFFAGNADFNADDATNSQDFFDFLACFFNGC